MSIDPREYIENDKRIPTSVAGDAGKVLAVKADESGYEHVSQSGFLTGQVIMWPFDTAPVGFLAMGATYNYDDYPALGALFGSTPGNTFDVPAITFAKNSNGTNTGTVEAASVGTHGHIADAVANHTHTVTVNSVGNHTHSSAAAPSGISANDSGGSAAALEGSSTGAAGAHGHTASANAGGGHTPIIQDHIGTNQPECTLLNFVIKT